MTRSWRSRGATASVKRTTSSAKPMARIASSRESFSNRSLTRARRRRPAVSTRRMRRFRHSQSIDIASRVIPGSRPGEHPIAPQKVVDQGRLASVGATEHGEPQGRVGVVFTPSVPALGLDGGDGVVQLDQTLPMGGGNRHRFAQAEAMRLRQDDADVAPLRLVGDQHDRGLVALQPTGEVGVERSHAGARVDHHQRQIGLQQGGLGLQAHAGPRAKPRSRPPVRRYRSRRSRAGRAVPRPRADHA